MLSRLKPKSQRVVTAVCVILAVASVALAVFIDPLIVVFGSPQDRQRVFTDWLNQTRKLGPIQRRVVSRIIYTEVRDRDAVGEALAVLNAHLHENEGDTVGHLIYVATTSKNPSDCHVALAGLNQVSPQYRELATAAFFYQLNFCDSQSKSNVLKLAASIAGLVKNHCLQAVPAITQLTTNADSYLSVSAQEAVAALALDRANQQPTRAPLQQP